MSASNDHPSQTELEQLGQQYMQENPDQYDTADLEALGAAVYVEQSPLSEEKAFVDIAQYINNNPDFHEQRFKLYKGAMGGDRFEEDIVERVSDVVDEANQTGSEGGYAAAWEALYREKVEDLDEADEIIEGMLNEVSELEVEDQTDTTDDLNVNWGNQILSETPENNRNFGNQIVLEELSGSSREASTNEGYNPEEVREWWSEKDTEELEPL